MRFGFISSEKARSVSDSNRTGNSNAFVSFTTVTDIAFKQALKRMVREVEASASVSSTFSASVFSVSAFSFGTFSFSAFKNSCGIRLSIAFMISFTSRIPIRSSTSRFVNIVAWMYSKLSLAWTFQFRSNGTSASVMLGGGMKSSCGCERQPRMLAMRREASTSTRGDMAKEVDTDRDRTRDDESGFRVSSTMKM